MEKMTNVKALDVVLGMELPADVREKIENIKASYTRKSATRSDKPTKAQIENEKLKSAILAEMVEGEKYTIADMLKQFECLADFSSQKATALLRQMREAGLVMREEIKRKPYYSKVVA